MTQKTDQFELKKFWIRIPGKKPDEKD